MKWGLGRATGLLFLIACSEDQRNDAGLQDAGAQDATVRDTGLQDGDVPPLLEGPTRSEFFCSVTHGVTELPGRYWSRELVLAADESGRFQLLRTESAEFQTDIEFRLSTLELDGTLGVEHTLSVNRPDLVSSYDLLVESGTRAIAWTEFEEAFFAAVDASGDFVIQPTRISPTQSGQLGNLKMARVENGYVVAWTDFGNNQSPPSIFVAWLDEQGVPRTAPRLLTTSQIDYSPMLPTLIVTENRLFVLWVDGERNGNLQTRDVYFASFDHDRNPIVSRTRLSPSLGSDYFAGLGGFIFVSSGLSAVPAGDGFIAAWVESYHAEESTGDFVGHAIVRVGRYEEDGTLATLLYRLQTAVRDVDHVEPRLFKVHDQIALAWSTGARIYICGGCVPDHNVNLVLLDPEDLIPVSAPISVDDQTIGGLLGHRWAVQGSDILAAISVTLHVSASPASASFRCHPL